MDKSLIIYKKLTDSKMFINLKSGLQIQKNSWIQKNVLQFLKFRNLKTIRGFMKKLRNSEENLKNMNIF